jgi:hypothetical protein
MWHKRECKLNLHYDYGFTLYEIRNDSRVVQLWRQSYEKLERSNDNSQHLLWLNFSNDEGEIVSVKTFSRCLSVWFNISLLQELDMKVSCKPFVFTLFSFLIFKLNRLGLKSN